MGDGGLMSSGYAVTSLSSVYYVPNYVSAAEEGLLLQKIYSVPATTWKTVTNRRVQNWGGIVHAKGLIQQPLPTWLQGLTQRIAHDVGAFPKPINHVLVNEYTPGQGIMPHQDGPLYFPLVAILSLGAAGIMRFLPHRNAEGMGSRSCSSSLSVVEGGLEGQPAEVSLALEPRSLLLFTEAAYTDYLHGVEVPAAPVHEESTATNATPSRISLTCRLVPKVMKGLFRP